MCTVDTPLLPNFFACHKALLLQFVHFFFIWFGTEDCTSWADPFHGLKESTFISLHTKLAVKYTEIKTLQTCELVETLQPVVSPKLP